MACKESYPLSVPLNILKTSLRKVTDTLVPHELTRLEQHKENIVAFNQEKNWEKLNVEQINASRTVQQLKGHLKTLDELRAQVRYEDLCKFDAAVEMTKKAIAKGSDEYFALEASVQPLADDTVSMGFEELTLQEQSLLIADKTALQSWEELRKELVELSEMVKMMSNYVGDQRKTVEKIEEHVDLAHHRVSGGFKNLTTAAKYSRYLLPVGGAVVGGVLGGVIGGPLGAIIGLKVAIATATTGTAGAVGGAVVGYKVQKQPITHQD